MPKESKKKKPEEPKNEIAEELKRLLVGKHIICIIFNSGARPDFALHGRFRTKIIKIDHKREGLEFTMGRQHSKLIVHLDLSEVTGIIDDLDDAYLSINTKLGQMDFVVEKIEIAKAKKSTGLSRKK